MMGHSQWPTDRASALLLFDLLTTPSLKAQDYSALLRPAEPEDDNSSDDLMSGYLVYFDIALRGDPKAIRRAWARAFAPHLGDAASDLVAIIDRQMRQVNNLMVSAGETTPGFDRFSHFRRAIDDAPRSELTGNVDVLVDCAREALEALLRDHRPEGAAYLDSWASCDVPLLRRLAMHGWLFRDDKTNDEKISWVCRDGRLQDSHLSHEATQLLTAALPDADDAAISRIVESVTDGQADVLDGDVPVPHRRMLLGTITRCAPRSHAARAAADRLQAVFGDALDEQPYDADDIPEGWLIRAAQPMTAAKLHAAIENDADAVMTELLGYRDQQYLVEGPIWAGVLSLVIETTSAHPLDGIRIIASSGRDADVLKAVVYGWQGTELPHEAIDSVAECLLQADMAAIADPVAHMLAFSDPDMAQWRCQPALRALAQQLWISLPTDNTDADTHNWTDRAYTESAGRLALYWCHEIRAERRAAGTAWVGLPDELCLLLDELVASRDWRSIWAQVVLMSRSEDISAADPGWYKSTLLPLLDWNKNEYALQAWDGFLRSNWIQDDLLPPDAYSYVIDTARNLDKLGDKSQSCFCDGAAILALQPGIMQSNAEWLSDFTAGAPPALRVQWIRRITHELTSSSEQDIETLWSHWLQPYWLKRLESVPKRLSAEEASAQTGWAVQLDTSFDEAAELAMSQPAGIENDSQVLDLLNDWDDQRYELHAEKLAHLIDHLLQGTRDLHWQCHELRSVVSRLKPHASASVLEAIINHAWDLGCDITSDLP